MTTLSSRPRSRWWPHAPLVGAACLALLSACVDGHGRSQELASIPHDASTSAVVAVARGKIEVQGGLLELTAQQDGVVQSLPVKEGDEVRRGQTLLQLVPQQARIEVGLAQAELQLAHARQYAQVARLPSARRSAQRTSEAARAGALEPQRADEMLQAQKDIEASIAVATADVAIARQKLLQAKYLAQRGTLHAPQDASIVKLNIQAGSRVAIGGRPLMVLLPHLPLVVRAELNESIVSSIKPGGLATVMLDTDAQGATSLTPVTARVTRISPVYSTSRLGDEAAPRSNVRVVDCFLEFDKAPNLRVGQDVRVTFHD